MICQYCRSENDENVVFCINCGKRLDNSIINDNIDVKDSNSSYCHNCGKKIGNVNYCPFCGTEITPSKPIQQVFNGKDYTNQSISANLFKSVNNSIGGQITFYNDYMNFKSHAINFEKANVDIKYKDIAKIEFTNFYFNLISTGLQVITKSGEIFKFVIWHRQEIKAFLDYKKS